MNGGADPLHFTEVGISTDAPLPCKGYNELFFAMKLRGPATRFGPVLVGDQTNGKADVQTVRAHDFKSVLTWFHDIYKHPWKVHNVPALPLERDLYRLKCRSSTRGDALHYDRCCGTCENFPWHILNYRSYFRPYKAGLNETIAFVPPYSDAHIH